MNKQILILITFLFAACTAKEKANKPLVAVTIVPQQYFVEAIADSLVEVMVLVEPGASPELYELRPVQMTALAQASAWLGIGKIDFEQGWKTKIWDNHPQLKFFDTSAKADWIAQEVVQHGDHQHLHGVDPHIWTSAKEGRKIAEQTYLALLELLPKHKLQLEANYSRLLADIQTLDEQLVAIFATSQKKDFLIFHPSLSYLARDYQLNQVPIELEGKEPSPKYVQQFVQQAQALGLNQILIQRESSRNTAEQLAKEIEGELVEINPLGKAWDKELLRIAHIISKN